MITSSLGTFFWIMSLYVYIFKYKMQLSKYYDFLFLALVVLFLYFINVEIMKERCGVYASVILPTLVPWIGIFLPFMLLLQVFPEWKTPFSNTFGYLIVYLTGGVRTIEKILVNQDKLALIYQSPSLLINQFTYDGFETEAAEKYKDVFQLSNVEAVNDFKTMLLLKEVVSVWIWYMLIASITISTSYIMMMNSECTKTVDDYLMANKKSTE
jgi:hypothetical protein